ncbi:MAG: hypothetical protein R3D83_02650 [Caenibius sp.]
MPFGQAIIPCWQPTVFANIRPTQLREALRQGETLDGGTLSPMLRHWQAAAGQSRFSWCG